MCKATILLTGRRHFVSKRKMYADLEQLGDRLGGLSLIHISNSPDIMNNSSDTGLESMRNNIFTLTVNTSYVRVVVSG